MTKKEIAQFEALENELRLAKAFRFTPQVLPDVEAPNAGQPDTKGYIFIAAGNCTRLAASSSSRHITGAHQVPDPRVGIATQGGIPLYSTKLLALRALRHEVEKECAARLAAIDKQIEAETPAQPL